MVDVGICAVGSELVSGDVADTNSSWLARRIRESGGEPVATVVVGDDHAGIVAALQWLAGRCDVLVVGGGLGPTADDLTRHAVADFAGTELRRSPKLTRHLDQVYARLHRAMPGDALRQADVPATADVHAPRGTAAGFSLNVRDCGRPLRVHVLPGVPWEFRELADRVVLPELVQRSGGEARVTRVLHAAGLGESAVGDVLRPVTDRLAAARSRFCDPEQRIDVGFLAASDEVLVRITASGPTLQAARARASRVVEEAADLLGEAVTSFDERRLEHEVGRLLLGSGSTVATAEVFTAGRVVATLAAAPAAADFLRGGFVAYTPEMVIHLLGIDTALVGRAGTADRAVVAEMARAVQQRCGTDLAIAVGGAAGLPAADQEPPGGAAVWAVAGRDRSVYVEEQFIPAVDHDTMQARTAALALESLRRHLVARRGTSGAKAGPVTP